MTLLYVLGISKKHPAISTKLSKYGTMGKRNAWHRCRHSYAKSFSDICGNNHDSPDRQKMLIMVKGAEYEYNT